ncbi:MAG: LPS assembly protein LptD, partial [Pseudomonadota bacterium]
MTIKRADAAVKKRRGVAGPAPVARALLCGAAVWALAVGAADAQPIAGDAGPQATEDGREFLGLSAETDDPATLEADAITYDVENEVVQAIGNVEIFHGETVLRADKVTYDAINDEVSAEGDVRLINADGSVISADQATIDSRLRNGIVQGARAVLADGRSRFAAVEGRRIDGSFTTLSKVVFSPCRLCSESETPFWRIRARKIIHDEVKRDIIYDSATFEVMGVPVGWLPRFSHPDPTVKRRSGFLTPSFLSADGIGSGVKTPYFWAFAPNRDVTIAPIVLTEDRPLLELQYRAHESFGRFNLTGSGTSSDDPLERGFRGHLQGDGRFDFGSGFTAGYDALIATDDTYLRRFQFTDTDRAEVRVFGQQLTDDRFARIETARFQSFRPEEFAGSIPLVFPQAEVDQFFDLWAGGSLDLQGDFLYLRRTEGLDVARFNGEVGFNQTLVSNFGVVLDARGAVRGDVYEIDDDPVFGDSTETRVLPYGSVAVSYPLGRVSANSQQVIEPIVRLTYAPLGNNPAEIPNEDSQDVDLDEINIFAINRSAGLDLFEDGARATVGLRYLRESFNGGPNVEAAIGQSFRFDEITTFNEGSGLNSVISDFVGGLRLSAGERFDIGHRFRISDSFSFERNEVFGNLRPHERLTLGGAYVAFSGDPEIGAEDDRAELTGNFELDLTNSWSVLGDVRRDLQLDRFVTTGGVLRFGGGCSDCIQVD